MRSGDLKKRGAGHGMRALREQKLQGACQFPVNHATFAHGSHFGRGYARRSRGTPDTAACSAFADGVLPYSSPQLRRMTIIRLILIALALFAHTGAGAAPRYAWPSAPEAVDTLAMRIAPPEGFVRTAAPEGSWSEWLRGLPMKPAGSPVLLYTGARKWRQDAHAAVIDIDVGKRDLQQCADAIMRLRAEWLYASGRVREIAFNDTDGKRRTFSRQKRQNYASFRKYMDLVFAYAGTYSLERELKPVDAREIAVGDVFIKGGFPGHAVLVADVAENATTGEKRFLLVQSYMPAQEMH